MSVDWCDTNQVMRGKGSLGWLWSEHGTSGAAIVPSHGHSLSNPEDRLVSHQSTDIQNRLNVRQRFPHASGHKQTSVNATQVLKGCFSLSQLWSQWPTAFASGSGASGPCSHLTSPEHLTKAIQLVEEEEAEWGSESLISCDLFQHDPRNLLPTWISLRKI